METLRRERGDAAVEGDGVSALQAVQDSAHASAALSRLHAVDFPASNFALSGKALVDQIQDAPGSNRSARSRLRRHGSTNSLHSLDGWRRTDGSMIQATMSEIEVSRVGASATCGDLRGSGVTLRPTDGHRSASFR